MRGLGEKKKGKKHSKTQSINPSAKSEKWKKNTEDEQISEKKKEKDTKGMSDFEDLPEDVRDELELRAATGQLEGMKGADVQDYDAQHAAYVPRTAGGATAATEAEDEALAALLSRAEGASPGAGHRGPPVRYYAACPRCGQLGHMARDCRGRPPSECFKCGAVGHLARDCPNPRGRRRPRSRDDVPPPSSSSSSSSSEDEERPQQKQQQQRKQQQKQPEQGKKKEEPVVISDGSDAEGNGNSGESTAVYCCNCGERGHEAAQCRRPRFDDRAYDVEPSRNRNIAWWKKSRSEAFIFGPRAPVEPSLSPSPPRGFESAITGVRDGGHSGGHGGNSGGGVRHGFRSQPQFSRPRSFVCGEDDSSASGSEDEFEFHTDTRRQGRRGGASAAASGTPPADKRRRRHW